MSTVIKDIPLGATLTEEQARQIFSQGEESVVFALLELAKRLAEQKATSRRPARTRLRRRHRA